MSTPQPAGTEAAMSWALVLLAAGSGTRVGAGENKVLLPLAGRPVLAWSLAATADLRDCVATVVVVRAEDEDVVRALVAAHAPGRAVDVVVGGATRHGSELNALRRLAPRIDTGAVDVVLVHDAARPLAPAGLYEAVARAARSAGGALPVAPAPGLVPADALASPGPADRLVSVQTPQGFLARELLQAYEQAELSGFVGTDTASCVEAHARLRVAAVTGSVTNIKVTFPEDLVVAERIVRDRPPGSAG